jgi:CrcB protein
MKYALLVFVGGGFGSVARYFISKWLNNVENTIPYGTLTVNVLGSLLIGVVIGYFVEGSNMSEEQTLLLATGFCGGFTTFSAFAYEHQLFLKNGDYLNFATYTLGSLVLGIAAIFMGLYLSRLL